MTEKINNTQRYIAYICPACDTVNKSDVSIFTFSGKKPINLLCESKGCSERCAEISTAKDKLEISVECPVCGHTHSYKLLITSFLSRNIMVFSCPESGIGIFFCGTKDAVEHAISDTCKTLADFKEEFLDVEDEIHIIYDIVDLVYTMIRNENIVCSCGCTDIFSDITDEGIELLCEDCGNFIVLPPVEDVYKMLKNAGRFEF